MTEIIVTDAGYDNSIPLTEPPAGWIAYYGWRTKPVQTKIWWDSGKSLRNVRTNIGKPTNSKPVTARVGFPANTKPVELTIPFGYNEDWKNIQLKAEKYSEMVTRVIKADTRPTVFGFRTKIVKLDIGKYPYNAKAVSANVELHGESIKNVRCKVNFFDWATTTAVSCKVNKSRQIIDVGCNVFLPRSQTVKSIQANIWWDTGESVKSVVANVVSTYFGTAFKSVRAKIPTPGTTHRTIIADIRPTHRWTPISCNVVHPSLTHRTVKTNVVEVAQSLTYKTIIEKIEKYAEHTKNLRARRVIKANVYFVEASNTRSVSANVETHAANTRNVKLKIHQFTVYGTITDEAANPVKDAIVFLYKRGSGEFIATKTTQTNSSGYYEIPDVPYGNYTIIAIKQARDLNFSPVVVNGSHVNIEKNMPLYKVGKDTCLEEIMSPRGDLFRFQVLYDEIFPDKSRIIDILLIWGDLYNQLPTYYRETDGIFMVETPEAAKLTVLHDFFETGGDRPEGKDDKFLTEITDVSWFTWRATLYYPNFIGFIVRCNTQSDVYTILSTNIGGYYDPQTSPPPEPGVPTPLPPGGKGSHHIHVSPGTQGVITPCRAGCEVSCQTACEAECQVLCEVGCQVTCESYCQEHCETACEKVCQVACLSHCQAYCQLGCEVKCQTTCQLACQTTCQLAYQEVCVETCQISCQLACQITEQITCPDCVTTEYFKLISASYETFPTISGYILDETGNPTAGTLDVIDKETGYLIITCKIGNNGFYEFAVPPNRCYILVMCKPGYRCQMVEVCIGETPVIDRNVTEFGGPPFECEVNCYYYNRAFEFPPLVPLADYYVYGHVYNSKTLEPIEGALVVADDYEGTSVSGVDGYYRIHLPAGSYDLVATKRKFKRATATVEITSGVEQDLYLDPLVLRKVVFTGGLTHKPIYM